MASTVSRWWEARRRRVPKEKRLSTFTAATDAETSDILGSPPRPIRRIPINEKEDDSPVPRLKLNLSFRDPLVVQSEFHVESESELAAAKKTFSRPIRRVSITEWEGEGCVWEEQEKQSLSSSSSNTTKIPRSCFKLSSFFGSKNEKQHGQEEGLNGSTLEKSFQTQETSSVISDFSDLDCLGEWEEVSLSDSTASTVDSTNSSSLDCNFTSPSIEVEPHCSPTTASLEYRVQVPLKKTEHREESMQTTAMEMERSERENASLARRVAKIVDDEVNSESWQVRQQKRKARIQQAREDYLECLKALSSTETTASQASGF